MSATANGKVAVQATLTIPSSGAWLCDIEMAEDVALSGRVALAIGDMTLSGTVYRSASFAGMSGARIVAGGAGWGKRVQARGYHQASGLQATQLIGDAARDAGEAIGPVPIGSVGTHYRRATGPASQVFSLLTASVPWWLDDAGVTQFGPRAPGVVLTSYETIDYDPIAGRMTIATDEPTNFRPGKSIREGTINAITWQVTPANVRGEVWVS